jgi:hypothetical protein
MVVCTEGTAFCAVAAVRAQTSRRGGGLDFAARLRVMLVPAARARETTPGMPVQFFDP